MFSDMYILGMEYDTWVFCLQLSIISILILCPLFRPKDFPFSRVQLFWVVVLLTFFGLMGGNLLNILIHLPQHQGRSIEEMAKNSGYAYLGGPIAVFFVLWFISKLKKVNFLILADYSVFFLMLERVIGRIGCLGAGCCYGIRSKLPWAYGFKGRMPGHPTQAYELIYALAILISGIYLYKRLRHIKGLTFFYVVLCYSFFRFFNEFLRAQGPFVYGAIKVSHIALFSFSIIALWGIFIIISKAPERKEIFAVARPVLVRLFLWLICSGVVVLTGITMLKNNLLPQAF